jgi:hypothetical protein
VSALTSKERGALLRDLQLYRPLVAYQAREVKQLDKVAAGHAAKALAAELSGDSEQEAFHRAMSRHFYAAMNQVYELRACNMAVIRSLEKDLNP